MKKLLFTLFLYALVVLISACSNNKSQDDHSGTHTHTDGTVHEEGDHEETDMPGQESFEVHADSTKVHDQEHDHGQDVAHDEDNGHDHDHEGDHDHQH